MYQRLRNHFGHTHWHSQLMRLKWKLDSVHFRDNAILDAR
jgi:hypothetical protein